MTEKITVGKYQTEVQNGTLKTVCKNCNKTVVESHPIYNNHLGEVLLHSERCTCLDKLLVKEEV